MDTKEYTVLDLYQFEFRLIPALIQMLNRDNHISVAEFLVRMSDLMWILETLLPSLRLRCGFDTLDLKISGKVECGKNFIIIYTFPFPAYSPLAKFGAIVLNSKGVNYYTLEKSSMINSNEEDSWVLGRTAYQGLHSNYGNVKDCSTIDDFVSLLGAKGLLEKENIILRMFKQLQKKSKKK